MIYGDNMRKFDEDKMQVEEFKPDDEELFYVKLSSLLDGEGYCKRTTLEALKSYDKQFPSAVGSIIKNLCIKNSISAADRAWLLDNMPKNEFPWRQVAALHAIQSDNMAWSAKLRQAVTLDTPWAVYQLFQTMSEEDFEIARVIILESKQRRNLRNALELVARKRFGTPIRNW